MQRNYQLLGLTYHGGLYPLWQEDSIQQRTNGTGVALPRNIEQTGITHNL